MTEPVQNRDCSARVDFGRTAVDYAKHRAGFTPRFFDEVARRIELTSAHVLDIGSGTGTLARGFAHRGAEAIALDPSRSLLEQAKRLASLEGVAMQYAHGHAERLPFPDESMDLVSAGQCWHWFDRERAAREVARVVRPGGKALIAHFDWVSAHPIVRRSIEIIDGFASVSPNWESFSRNGLYPRWLQDLNEVGLTPSETFSFTEDIPYSLEDWVGRLRASARVGGSLAPAEVARVSDALTEGLGAAFEGQHASIPHRTWAVIGCAPI